MINRLRFLKRLYSSHSFFGWDGYIKLVNLHCQALSSDENKRWNANEAIHLMMRNYIDNNWSQYRIQKYQGCKAKRSDIDDQNIWVCWLQGEDHMPDVVRICYKRLKKYSNGHRVILITWENLNEYLEISPIIKEKIGKELSFMAFSDYLRLNLLSIYGGLWIDSTFYITAPLDESIFHTKFFSIKNNIKSNAIVCRYLWAVNFVYCEKNCEYIQHIRNLFSTFWEKSKKSVNYLFIDYCFEFERLSNPEFDKYLTEMPYSNEHSHEIREHYNDTYSEDVWNKWTSNTTLFKLSYKGLLKTETSDGKMTNYGYVLSH